ncbi:glycosyltransferase family 9 protein [Burkholderia glumae]|uniref:glycosyltransferase family 9 protein n=1 Tax=Burkholderia glumae TaxID=337 RepID=UPI002151C796|nr:glycosyltransferase family 9 protein [Burkholderia glumae]UVS95498.1 glycosyltransferase family 9 protein [Burkholderia glumae]
MNDYSFPMAPAPRRIAVLRALPCDDLLDTVPALRALRRAAPQARISLVGLPRAQRFVERYPDLLDELIVFPAAPGFPAPPEADAGLPDFLARLRARRFDLAIQLHGSGGGANTLLREFGARANAGFVERGEALPHGCFIACPDTLPEAQRCLALMEALGAPATGRQPAFALQRRDPDECAALVATHGLEPERLVLIHPGARLPSRRWPAEHFAAVADNLAADGWQIAITGTAADAPATGAVLGEMTAPALHLTGLTSLGGMTALVARSRLVVCNDTSIARIAAAMGTASVVVAAGRDARHPAPPDPTRQRVQADCPPRRPCLLRDDCPHDPACTRDPGVERVVGAALAQLHRVRGAQPAAPNVLHTAAGLARAAREWHHAA